MLDDVLKEVLDLASTVPVSPRIVQGRPAPVLVATSEAADLLVLGARDHGAFSGMPWDRSASTASNTRHAPWW